MASQTQGIQQLLAAEKKAAEKVSEARRKKTNRLKAAKKEADAEINAYKSQRETQYKGYEASILGSKGDMESKIESSTRQKIKDLNSNVDRNKEEAMRKLLSIVLDIQPELHTNLRL